MNLKGKEQKLWILHGNWTCLSVIDCILKHQIINEDDTYDEEINQITADVQHLIRKTWKQILELQEK
jgi:hypothetical protein